jgi:Fe2+ or Zn2+ uptake regulation protein
MGLSMRMTENRRRILDALQCRDFLEHGTPPYNAATIATMIDAPNINNVGRTLRALEALGLVVPEKRAVPVWSEVQSGHCNRVQCCYWNVETKEQDKAAAKEWLAGADERQEKALDTLITRFYGH